MISIRLGDKPRYSNLLVDEHFQIKIIFYYLFCSFGASAFNFVKLDISNQYCIKCMWVMCILYQVVLFLFKYSEILLSSIIPTLNIFSF